MSGMKIGLPEIADLVVTPLSPSKGNTTLSLFGYPRCAVSRSFLPSTMKNVANSNPKVFSIASSVRLQISSSVLAMFKFWPYSFNAESLSSKRFLSSSILLCSVMSWSWATLRRLPYLSLMVADLVSTYLVSPFFLTILNSYLDGIFSPFSSSQIFFLNQSFATFIEEFSEILSNDFFF